MRPLGTWVVIGALALIGLFAARDALRGDEAPASSAAVQTLEERRHAPPAVARLPLIADKDRLAAELQALGAGGVLYLTDANCRRYLLGLPALVWTTEQGLPGPDCSRAGSPVVSERSGLAAEQVGAETIEVSSEIWSFRFPGFSPAFKPSGTLTFVRDGRVYEWTSACQARAPRDRPLPEAGGRRAPARAGARLVRGGRLCRHRRTAGSPVLAREARRTSDLAFQERGSFVEGSRGQPARALFRRTCGREHVRLRQPPAWQPRAPVRRGALDSRDLVAGRALHSACLAELRLRLSGRQAWLGRHVAADGNRARLALKTERLFDPTVGLDWNPWRLKSWLYTVRGSTTSRTSPFGCRAMP